ncbi:hypothetical protein GGR53DRAFT_513579 [Hypoxylon sp. FL1150]|nr:hypothetical protein GGR53DRAFT_513579 [Hypoxylon sp. FL1150]
MTIILNKVFQPSTRTYNIVIRDHSKNTVVFCAPRDAEYVACNHKVGEWYGCTELNVTSNSGRAATVQLEHGNGQLIVSGNIKGGRKVVDIDADDDDEGDVEVREVCKPIEFDIMFSDAERMVLRATSYWGNGWGYSLEFVLVKFGE